MKRNTATEGDIEGEKLRLEAVAAESNEELGVLVRLRKEVFTLFEAIKLIKNIY